MKIIESTCLIFLSCLAVSTCGQCSFQYISNDTVFQDYIEAIYPRKNVDEIITIGSRINRGIINDSLFNAPIFQTFDYCGNLLNKIVYKYIGNARLKHRSIPTHNTYKEEPIGNTVIRMQEDEFLLVDKATDTLAKESVLILFKINAIGVLKGFKTLTLNNNEANQLTIKTVLELENGKILVILWDYAFEYVFFYFDKNADFLYKKSFNLGRGIRSLISVDNGEFICTSLAYDNASFQFYRLDTAGEIKWLVTPYSSFGSAREILIKNNKIYLVGGINYGVFLIYDIDGNMLKEFKFDSFYCQQRLCNTYLDSDNSFIISGYIEHCESSDVRGSDVAIFKFDTNGTISWSKVYDFRNALGTSGSQGYYTDYGGFEVAKTNDGGFITNGMSRYARSSQGGVFNEDALLIKTEPLVISANEEIKTENIQFELLANLLSYNLNIKNRSELIKEWTIYSLNGESMLQGRKWNGPVPIENFESGMYVLRIIDNDNHSILLKFIKL